MPGWRRKRLPLLGILKFGTSKDYCFPKITEMLEECCEGIVEILWVSESKVGKYETITIPMPGMTSEEMCMEGRALIRVEAICRDSPAYVFQGIDCFYRSRAEFKRLIDEVVDGPYLAVGGLTCARSDSHHAVARRFLRDEWGARLETQADIDADTLEWAIEEEAVIEAGGFVGADAFVCHRDLFGYGWEGHTPWYVRVSEGRPNLCAEEWMMLQMVRGGHRVHLDCGVRTWHVHEDGVARMYPGVERPLETLGWG